MEKTDIREAKDRQANLDKLIDIKTGIKTESNYQTEMDIYMRTDGRTKKPIVYLHSNPI